jgi:hypothetical protein
MRMLGFISYPLSRLLRLELASNSPWLTPDYSRPPTPGITYWYVA